MADYRYLWEPTDYEYIYGNVFNEAGSYRNRNLIEKALKEARHIQQQGGTPVFVNGLTVPKPEPEPEPDHSKDKLWGMFA